MFYSYVIKDLQLSTLMYIVFSEPFWPPTWTVIYKRMYLNQTKKTSFLPLYCEKI